MARARLLYLDTTRGLLFCVMTLGHALALAGWPTGWLAESYWPFRGASSHVFIAMSGFTVALVFDWREEPARTARRVRRRAGAVLAVMFVSNVIMLALGHAVRGELAALAEPAWWLGLLTFQTPYSISSVLMPIGLLIWLTPWLAALGDRYGYGKLLAGLLGLLPALWHFGIELRQAHPDSHVLRILFGSNGGAFCLAPMIGLGAVGFALGRLWQEANPWGRGAILAAGFAVLVGLWLWIVAGTIPLADGLRCWLTVGRFLLILALGIAVTALGPLRPLWGFLPLIGRYALFSFLMHRVVLQALVIGTRQVDDMPTGDALIAFYVAGTLAIVAGLCLVRQFSQRCDMALKSIWL